MCSTKKTTLLGSGIATIVFTTLLLIWQIANDIHFGLRFLQSVSAAGYWAGILFIVVGILAAIGGHTQSKGVIIGAFVMSIITLIIAGIGAVAVYGAVVGGLTMSTDLYLDADNVHVAVLYVLWVPLLLFSIVLVILDIVVLVVTSAYICTCCCDKPDQDHIVLVA